MRTFICIILAALGRGMSEKRVQFKLAATVAYETVPSRANSRVVSVACEPKMPKNQRIASSGTAAATGSVGTWGPGSGIARKRAEA